MLVFAVKHLGIKEVKASITFPNLSLADPTISPSPIYKRGAAPLKGLIGLKDG